MGADIDFGVAPEGYKFVCFTMVRTTGFVGSPYVGSWRTTPRVVASVFWQPVSGEGKVEASAVFVRSDLVA